MENKIEKMELKECKHNMRFRDKAEHVGGYIGTVCQDGEILVPVDVRFYMGRSSSASVVKCAIWIYSTDHHGMGYGSAGGYGYDKQSAALDEAIESCGIKLKERIGGVGDSACVGAIDAILAYLYPQAVRRTIRIHG